MLFQREEPRAHGNDRAGESGEGEEEGGIASWPRFGHVRDPSVFSDDLLQYRTTSRLINKIWIFDGADFSFQDYYHDALAGMNSDIIYLKQALCVFN